MARQQLGSAPSRAADAIPKSFIRYDIGMACTGKPSAGEVIGFFLAPVAFTLPANLAGSVNRALTAAAASALWTLSQIPVGSNTETVIAIITFSANGTIASYSNQSAVAIAAGDILRLKAPSPQDSALSDITFTIVGVR